MQAVNEQETFDGKGVSRRDFLKLFSLVIGVSAFPKTYTSLMDLALVEPGVIPFNRQPTFQWQNEFLLKTIYPMREAKLRDFLTFYMEVDTWTKLKGKDIKNLAFEVSGYIKAWELNAAAALKEYLSLRAYFFNIDVRQDYSKFQPIDEAEMAGINNLHELFHDDWPKDIRGERSFVEGLIAGWAQHRNGIRDWIRGRRRRHDSMDPAHIKYESEGRELTAKETITLPMADQEMEQLGAFLATYDRLEERKLAWYKLSKSDPAFTLPEAEFLVQYPPGLEVTVREIAYWQVEEYSKSIAKKNQYELLDLIRQRFQKEPGRFPPWLQYMVVHFSGMRYASAHGSWADPGDLLIRLGALGVQRELQPLDDAEIEKRSLAKVLVYGSAEAKNKPKLALAVEKEWKDKTQSHLTTLKAGGPDTRRAGLLALQIDEVNYEIKSLPSGDVLKRLLELKSTFPKWAWKEIVRYTSLRVTEVADLNWEKLTPLEEDERFSKQNGDIRAVMDEWENYDPTAWREEHGRTLELIVTRAVCNEVAEQCQHIRGHMPPGGLAARPKWYTGNESGNQFPGSYFVKPSSEMDYVQGASILWLRFVNFSANPPSQWQIAKWIETKQKDGLLPDEFLKKRARIGNWDYTLGEIITRSRATILQKKQKVMENQWLRWIHEATVAEVAETADGMTVITFETSRPDGDQATSSVGMNKLPLNWLLSDGTEDQYNRSFVGFVPEGQAPVEQLKVMMDWNKIFRK